mgnify:CR=1 FL=1
MASFVPLDRMLIETDSPYLAPVPHRGQRNQPAWVTDVGVRIAALKHVDVDDVAASTWTTAIATYGLPPA